MSRDRNLTYAVLVAALILAAVFLRPAPDAEIASLAPAATEQVEISESAMMTLNRQGTPVFGFQAPAYQPYDHRSATRALPDVDTIYQGEPAPRLGRLQTSAVGGVCPTTLTARAGPLAMVDLTLQAPCYFQTRFIVEHGPMQFAMVTNEQGVAKATVPALTDVARFVVLRDGIELTTASLDVPDMRNFDRIALHWRSAEAIDLHAFEEAAFIGSPGHIWSAAPGSVDAAASGARGHLFEIGDAASEQPMQTEVFTFPAGRRAADGDMLLRISNLLNPRNCGREIDFVAIESYAGATPVATQLNPKMPSCDQIGYVVLLAKDLPTLLAEAN